MPDASVGGTAPAILPSSVIAGAPADATPNRLVEALVALSEHHGRAMSAGSLMIGLPLERHELPLDLLERAAERAGLVAEWTDAPRVKRISPLVLPAILLTKDGTCVVVQAADPKARTFEVLDPVSRAVSQVAAKALQKTSSRRLAVVRPSDGRSVSAMEGEDRPHWFWSVVTRFWPNYVQVLLGALFINLLALAVPLFSMTVFDRVVPNFAETTLWTLAIGASLALLFDVVLRTVRAVIVEVVGRRTDLVLSSRIFEHVLAVRLSNRPAMAGAFASQIREFDAVREFFTSASLVAAIDFLFIGLFIGVMFLVAGPLAWVAVAAIPAVALITLLAQIPLGKAVERGQREAATRHAVLVEAVSSLDTVKSVGAEGRMQRNWERSVAAAARANHDSRFWATVVLNLTSAIQQGVTIVVLVWGVYLVNAGTITMGAMVAATILAGRALAPLAGIAATLTRAQQTRSALRTLDKVMAMPSERGAAKGVVRPVATGALRFDSVTFAYPDAASPALRDVSFAIASGERVGLIGRVGSGKSTIGRLANGLYMPERGSVLVDGVDTRQFDMASLRQGVAYVSQDPALFLGSLRDNIAIGRPGATDAEVLAAARQAGVDDFAARHPRGYDMVIGEGGRTLSGGQKQAVALARALLTHPKLLFLDEPSSAMDSLTEAMLTERIEHLLDPTMTLVVSTHRLSMLRLATRVLVLDQGRIIADGPRDAILERLAREAGQQQARNDRGAA